MTDALTEAIARASGSAPLIVLVDVNVAERPWFGPLERMPGVRRVARLAPHPSVEAVAETAALLAIHRDQVPVAVGGGSVLDIVRLASLIAASGAQDAHLGVLRRGRSGLVDLPQAGAQPRVLAVPTTLGTGAETSASACVLVGDRRRLVVSAGLRARAAIHEPRALRSLPRAQVGESLLEVIMRVVGPFLGSRPHRGADGRAIELLIELLDEARSFAAGRPPALARVARCSAASHGAEAFAGRSPFSPKLWYVANELAQAAGLAKMTAHRVLMAPFLRRIAAGDSRWGSAERLRELTDALRPHVPGEPAGGWLVRLSGELVAAPARLSPGLAPHIARQAVRAWGAGQAALAALSTQDILELVSEGLHDHAQPA